MTKIRPTIKTTALPLNPADFGVGAAEEVKVSLTHCTEGWHKWGIVMLNGDVKPLQPDHFMPGCGTDGRITVALEPIEDRWI